MNHILKKIQSTGVIPVVKIDKVNAAVPLAKALCEGGLHCAEVTFRTATAKESIKQMVQAYPDMLVGAGTVLNIKQVDEAMEAGAKFIVSPGLNPRVVQYCNEKGILMIPGCANPSDVEEAIQLGLDVVKFFPAEAAGGLKMIKAMASPYGNIKFMPTGGINLNNLESYLSFNKIIACGGTWMVTPELIESGNFEEIKKLTRQAVEKMLGFELLHVGIHPTDSESPTEIAGAFENLFGFKSNEKESAIFAGTYIEALKNKFLGTHGHLAIGTNNIDRAIYYLENQGYEVDENNKFFNEKGNLISNYLKKEIGGFAIHLLQK